MRMLPTTLLLLLLPLHGLLLVPPGEAAPREPAPREPSPRDAMRTLVRDLSAYAKARRPGFLVLPLNAEPLTRRGDASSAPHDEYLDAVDGFFIESLHFAAMDSPRDPASTKRRLETLYGATKRGLPLLVIDYATRAKNLETARRRAARHGHALFLADRRELDTVPRASLRRLPRPPRDIGSAREVRDFVYLVNPGRYRTPDALARDIAACPADLAVVDPWFRRGEPLPREAVERMKHRRDGSRRPVIAYLSVGEAEDYRTYWRPDWRPGSPAFLVKANPDWPDNFVVRYWDPAWRALLFGSPDAGLDRILAQGFDGVALDTVDSYHWFERD